MTKCCKNITLSRLFHVEHQFRMILNSSSRFVLKIDTVEKENRTRTNTAINNYRLYFKVIHNIRLTYKRLQYIVFLMIYLKLIIKINDKSI